MYRVGFIASDGRGGSCEGAAYVCVPHDRGRGSACVDDGQTVNSLASCGPAKVRGSGDEASPALRITDDANPGVLLSFDLPAGSEVDIAAYDVAGRRVMQVERAYRGRGRHQVRIETANLPRGVYYVRLAAGDLLLRKTLLLVR